ncbi:hypothetical protein M426DRAFT_321979 [Hypoxylon sp. CI-4A]|nr:hypothetical protein M426DRAFT_321979 [Hypoxylon sp. CI-4A]
MIFSRIFRPLTAQTASISTQFTRFVLPIHSRRLTTSTIESSEQSVSPPPPSSSTPPAESRTPAQLPYFVGRNNLNNLGVYHKSKRGGNLKLTLLKNGEGNLQALKRDIREALQLNEGDISVNSVTQHVIIRGHKKLQVLNFLGTMGF